MERRGRESAGIDPALDQDMRRLLHERFGDVGLGDGDPGPRPNIERYGHRFMAAFWGCEIRYLPGQAPAAIPLPDARRRMVEIEVPDLETSPVIRAALEDTLLLESRYGRCDRSINLGGPLNNALSVFGAEMLLVLAEDPALAVRVLEAMESALVRVHDRVTLGGLGPTGSAARPGVVGLGNCPVCMISPRTYRDVVLPVDLRYRSRFSRLSLHHCGAVHPYAGLYRELSPDLVDAGWLSDRAATRKAFPTTPLSLMVEASALAGKTGSDIDDLVRSAIAEAGPAELVTKVWVAEAGTEISDNAIRDLVTAPTRLGGGTA